MFRTVQTVHYKGLLMFVYLLHFDDPLSHARHYLGSANQLLKRLTDHAAGDGARITQVLHERGLAWQLCRVWIPRTPEKGEHRKLESILKNQHNGPRYCPICNGQAEESSPPGFIDYPFEPFHHPRKDADPC